VKLLASASRLSFGRQLDSTLPVAGYDGTLRNRMIGTLAENNVHAKTGTHGNVSALSGYVTTLDGERLAFAFMFNGPSVGVYKTVENELGTLLAQFFYFNEEK
jgi:D-alanyl-D-alanine carboxypeptidase